MSNETYMPPSRIWYWSPSDGSHYCVDATGVIMRVDQFTHEWSQDTLPGDARRSGAPPIDND